MARVTFMTVSAALAASVVLGSPAAAAPSTGIGPMDWRTYGRDAGHAFAGQTSITKQNVTTLQRAWFFGTGDAVTANPVVVAGTVYVGSWDGRFYALDAATGKERWHFTVDPQPTVSPVAGTTPPERDITSDGGLITSAAWFEPAAGGRPDTVLFAGGHTMYSLRAATGELLWKHVYPGRPELPPTDPLNTPDHDGTRIFSSPVVVGDEVVFGVTPDGQDNRRGYVQAADLATGNPRWRFETDVDSAGKVVNDGCGGVWSSPTVVARLGLVVVDVADCHFSNTKPYDETVIALHSGDGSKAWAFRPARPDNGCDFDFGATVNLGTAADGTPTFLGVGGKDGTYYSLDPTNGGLRWQRNVVFGGFAGGFIASLAYDGRRVYGITALGDVGRFEGFPGSVKCDPSNPADLPLQEPSMHAINAADGTVAWQAPLSQGFAPTAVAGGMTFVGTGVVAPPQIQIRDAETGTLLDDLVPIPPDVDPAGLPPFAVPNSLSGVAVVGNAAFFGTGTSEQGRNAGVYAYTPGGVPPSAPAATLSSAPPPDAAPAAAAPAASRRGQGRLPATGGGPPFSFLLALIACGAAARGSVTATWGRAGRRRHPP